MSELEKEKEVYIISTKDDEQEEKAETISSADDEQEKEEQVVLQEEPSATEDDGDDSFFTDSEDDVSEEEDTEQEAMSPDTELRISFMTKSILFFKDLQIRAQEDAVEEENEGFKVESIPYTVSDDGYRFDEPSIKEALTLCEYLQDFIDHLSDEKFKELQVVYSFYADPDEMLEKIKMMFAGNVNVKEKIVRIYGTKAIGTYNVTKYILEKEELFENMEEDEVTEIREKLLDNAEEALKMIKNLMPRTLQGTVHWTRKRLSQNIRYFLSQPKPLFQRKHRYSLIVERFREFIYWLYGNPFVMEYLEWKHKYLKHWLHNELYQLDIGNIDSKETTDPHYSSIKVKIYQKLDELFASLEGSDKNYDHEYQLKKLHTAALRQKQSFILDEEGNASSSMVRAREAESELLGILTPNQLATVAAAVHAEISTARKENEQQLGKLPSNADTHSSDMDSEQANEQKYTSATIKAQVDHAKEEGFLEGGLLKSLKKIAQNLNLIPSTPSSPPEPENFEEDTIPRLEGCTGDPLESVTLDWYGFGKEYKTTIYEEKIPSLQRNFFDQDIFDLHIYKLFVEFAKEVIGYYQDFGYIEFLQHTANDMIDGSGNPVEFEEEAIYLKTGDEDFIALGHAVFGKANQHDYYFQLYRRKPIKKYRGTSKNIDFTRDCDGVKYELESFSLPTQVRPVLFRNLIVVADSLPDGYRNDHLGFLRGMYDFFESENITIPGTQDDNNRRSSD